MWTPRPYQAEAIDAALDALAGGEDALLVVPTGGGKSGIIGTITKALYHDFSLRIVNCAHVAELVGQAYDELIGMWEWAPAGIYSAGLNRREMHSQILFAGIASIFKKAHLLGQVDVLMVDEAHMIPREGNGQYRRFISDLREMNPDMRLLGLTATPYRLGSGRLDEDRVTKSGAVEPALFPSVTYEVSIRHLIDEGWLAPLTTKDTGDLAIDTSGVGSSGGDFKIGELSGAVDKPELIRDICADVIAKGKDRRSWLIFTPGVSDAEHFHEEMTRRGFRGGVITGETPTGERKRLIEDFKNYRIRYLVNCGVLTTGFDHKGVDLLAMVRPTKSTALYVQICGRGTRPLYEPGFNPNTATAEERKASIARGPKPNCLVLDYAKNINYHGPVDMVQPRKPGSGKGEAPVKTCPPHLGGCSSVVHASVMECPDCGFLWERQVSEKITRRAAEVPILSKSEPLWIKVQQRTFRRHEKLGKPPSVKVEYRSGITIYPEWIAVENERARGLVSAWWKRAGGAEPAPTSVTEMLDRVGELRPIDEIRVEAEGKYWRVTGWRHAQGQAPEGEADKSASWAPQRYDLKRDTYADLDADIPF